MNCDRMGCFSSDKLNNSTCNKRHDVDLDVQTTHNCTDGLTGDI